MYIHVPMHLHIYKDKNKMVKNSYPYISMCICVCLHERDKEGMKKKFGYFGLHFSREIVFNLFHCACLARNGNLRACFEPYHMRVMCSWLNVKG